MNVYKLNEEYKKQNTIIIFGGIGTPYIDIMHIIDTSLNACYYIFEYTINLFVESFEYIINITLLELEKMYINSNNIFIGISIGGLIISNLYKYYCKLINNIILLDTTNITTIPYLISMKKKNKIINYDSIIQNINLMEHITFDNINTISHINLKKYNILSKKYNYFKNISTNSQVYVYINISHDLHLHIDNIIKNNINYIIKS